MTHLGIGESQWTPLLNYHHHLSFAKWKAFWSCVGVRTHPRWLTENRRSLKEFQLLLEPLCTTQHRNTKYSSKIYEPLPTSRWGPRPRPHPWFYGQNHTASCSGRPGIQELFSNVNWGAYCSNCISLWFWITSKHEPQMDHFQHKVGSTCIMEGDSTLVRLCTFEDCMTVWGDGEKIAYTDCPIYKSNWV